jgi:GNAT superfamily N-acetyltransferase
MIIRPATVADIPWLIEAGERAQKESPNYAELPASSADQYKQLVRILLQPDAVCVRVVGDGTGFICGALEPAVWFEAVYAVQNLLWVEPLHRGSGRAWRLIAAFEQWARDKGARRIYNGISSGINEEKVGRFYQKMGYAPAGPTFVKDLT